MTKAALSVAEFCKAHSISRATFYNQRKIGLGPRTIKVGSRRLITKEAAEEWRRRMEIVTQAREAA